MGGYVGDAEFRKFLEATSYIQEFTRILLARSANNLPKVPDDLASVSQLTDLVKEFLREQQELAEKIEIVQNTQKTMNLLVKEKLSKCTCEMKEELKSTLSNGVNLQDMRRENGMDFTLKLPSTSSTNYMPLLNQQLEADLQQTFDLQTILGRIRNFSTPQLQPDPYQENGHFIFDSAPSQQHSTSSPPKKTVVKKRAAHHESINNGPYQCRDCDKTFRQKHGLSQHLLTHESNGAFECDGCGKRYSRQESVYRHQRSTQCCADKYHSLTNVRHHNGQDAGPSEDPKNIQLMSPSFIM
ncbi:hypothetical protein GCK72_003214 [Caenorhabditis remanei]|uniref:C2H2-type domain-containing protein n=1 Tax=Caenorhabditis remanei TaxID=31234 RepID=A0A6A5HTW4_CAERE|nr:hypothetical protein GCK72_003214 [Caenorhabditis remanei]KAF1771388.1 hypothetical protein GCK72_003214 [Caenorhabditis remanei]